MRNLWVRLASWLRRRAQPAPLASGHPFEGATEAEIKGELAALIRGSYDEGVAAERARVAEILQAPNAAQFLELAMDLALGNASGAQAAAVLSRAENDAAKRVGLMKSPLESASSGHVPTLH
jgi:hypothetical protein